jgi:hypothetical protein
LAVDPAMKAISSQILVALGIGTIAAIANTKEPVGPDLPRMLQVWSPTEPSMINLDCQPTARDAEIDCGHTQVMVVTPPREMSEQLKEMDTPAGQYVLTQLCVQVTAQTKAEREATLVNELPQRKDQLRAIFNACLFARSAFG